MTEDQKYTAQSLVFAEEILTTEDLVLRAPTIEDAADIAALANNENVVSMLESLPYPYYDEDAKRFIESISHPDAGECVFAITHADTGQLMGMCGLHLLNAGSNCHTWAIGSVRNSGARVMPRRQQGRWLICFSRPGRKTLC